MGSSVFSALALAGIGYAACALARLAAFGRRAEPEPSAEPGISILKPLHGAEPRLHENLASFCRQDYTNFEIIFGATSPEDAALVTARAMQRQFPSTRIRIVCGGGKPEDGNPKVRNLQRMIREARHALIVTADSDIEVGPEYLRAIAAAFEAADVGAATCLYGGVPIGGMFAQLGAMHVNEYFAPSVLVATMLAPLQYCFGATVALRREALERIGGFAALGAELADDYAIGRCIAREGYRVSLCPYVVTTTVRDEAFSQLWAREVRWARTIRFVRPFGYAGSVVIYGPALAAAAVLLRPSFKTGALLVLASALRLAIRVQAKRIFAGGPAASPLLIPLREFLEVAVWCAAWTGGNVRWGGARYAITRGGLIRRNKRATSVPSSRAERRTDRTPLR